MYLLYKLFAMHNLRMFWSKFSLFDIVTVFFVVSIIVKCEHSALYCATEGHSILNLRNTLLVWWRYELCEDTETSQCRLNAVKTKHIITKYFVYKSSLVCNMVKYVVEIIVVWLQLFNWRLLVSGTKSNWHGSKWHEMSRKYELVVDMMLCLMSRYLKILKLICLQIQLKSTSD